MVLREWAGLTHDTIGVQQLHEDVRQWCASFEEPVPIEKVFAVFVSRFVEDVLKARLHACAKREGVDVPSDKLCGIEIAVPVLTVEKETALRCALREMCQARGIDERCMRLQLEPIAATHAVIRAISHTKRSERAPGRDVSLCDGDEILVLDAGGQTTVDGGRNVQNGRTKRIAAERGCNRPLMPSALNPSLCDAISTSARDTEALLKTAFFRNGRVLDVIGVEMLSQDRMTSAYV